LKKKIAFLLTVFLIAAGLTPPSLAEDFQPSRTMTYFSNEDSYYNYLLKNPLDFNNERIVINAVDFAKATQTVKQNDKTLSRDVLLTGSDSAVSWNVEVPRDGSYSIEVLYLPVQGAGGNIARTFKIDGNLPFAECYNLEFSRCYVDSSDITADAKGNDIRPAAEEVLEWRHAFLKDTEGLFGDRLYFALKKGRHTIELDSLSEPMAISEIVISSKKEMPASYEEILKKYKTNGSSPASGVFKNGISIYQAEDPYQKSDITLYPLADNSSAVTQPYAYNRQKLNTIGGTRWQSSGQWISYKISVPEDGLYQIGFRFKQNFIRDISPARELRIDGEIPFAEASNITFGFANDFQVMRAGKKNPYDFYLSAGEHEIKLSVVLGEISPLLVEASASLSELNSASWYLLSLLGSNPDIYKSYSIETQLPNVITIFKKQAEKVRQIADMWEKLTGNIDSNVSRLRQLALKLSRMAENPDKIPGMYIGYKDDVSALGNLIVNAGLQPLLLDYVFLAQKDAPDPRSEADFFTTIKNGVLRFFNSFFNDYNVISSVDNKSKEAITVWIGNGVTGGRDQALAINQMITQEYSSKSGLPVRLQLVPSGTILTATLAGVGPDVALQVGGSEPANYAMRNAIVDLKGYPDYNEIIKRFIPASYKAYEYEGGTYALPETLSFPMLFYRTDIMEMLGIKVENIKTWQDIINILPIIQRLNMNFAMPASAQSYLMLLYQNGGEIYKDGGKKTALDSKTALDTFNSYMDMYTSYGLPYAYSFEMRFRTGEIPIGIADYTTYNLLQISAPEIKGRWAMTTVPGSIDKNGAVHYDVTASGAGCVIMSASRNKDSAWDFIKWWTGSEPQFRFGKELESVMGIAARYNTANTDAFRKLPWKSNDLKSLLSQMSYLKGVPEVPGGYITSRDIDFAIKAVYNTNADARTVLKKYVKDINSEIQFKREEFGLSK
jgi:ABC-type glycerol-3-phosphate transport system substrate-binding protein